jgi:hypothetical protein
MFSPVSAAGGYQGNINGTLVDLSTKAPVVGATVILSSASATYTAKTDAHGFFQINGVPTDTYVLTFVATGYPRTSLTGVTIQGDQTLSAGQQTITKIATIGTVRSQSVSSVFQPTQTTDQTTISGTRALIAAGKAASTDESALALSVPGVQLDDSGALIIRGGLKSEVGYQLDGVPITEPFLGGNGTNGFINGLGSLQVVEGQGDASQGNVGAGVINIVPKRGTSPPFGLFDIEAGGPNFNHQGDFEFGIASPNGRVSDYVSYNGQRYVPYYGYRSDDPANYGDIDGVGYVKNDDILNNFIYKFGKNNAQSVKVLLQFRDLQEYGDVTGLTGRVPYTANPYFYSSLLGESTLTPAQIAPYLPILPYAPTSDASPTEASLTSFNPTRFFEAEYDNSLDASTFLAIKSYNFNQIQGGTNYYPENTSGFGNAAFSNTGGSQTGVKLDITRTFGEKNTVTLGASIANNHPIWDGLFAGDSAFLLTLLNTVGATGVDPSIADFLPGGYANAAANNGPIPSFGINYNKTDFQIGTLYLRDQFQATSKLKFDLGLREDIENWKQGANPYNPDLSNPDDVPVGGNTVVGVGDNYLRNAVVHPRIFEPRAAVNYEIDRNNSVSASYGVSTIFPNAQTLGTPGAMYNVEPGLLTLAPLPGTNTANPATWSCGSGYNAQYLQPGGANASGSGGSFFRCTSYAQQLYWLYDQNFDAPDAGNNTPPINVDKDFTYQHQFKDGTGLRFTTYYDRGFSIPEENIISQILNAQGVPISQVFGVTNLGNKQVTGLELGLTTRDRPVGFTGFLSMTYTNVLNSVPPLVAGEDALPLVPKASIVLGDEFRAGYISPFTTRIGAQYKFRNGFRINPVISYDRGFPTGVGNIIPTQYPGGYANLPQTNVNPPTYSGFTGVTGSYNATNYVDPTNPGTIGSPNIAATRGTPETSAAGGILTRPRVNTDISFEYKVNRNTFGVQLQNLFGNVYSEPIYNPYWQPVATGIGGPQTATTGAATPGSTTYVYGGFRNIPFDAYGNSPYIELPNRPLTYRLYYQVAL